MKLLRFLLFPFAVVYDLITSIRNMLFDSGILKSTSFDIPVIAVGNLNVGGTGKTPQIEYLINLLQNDYKIAVLSRGYKRKTKGYLLLNNSNSAEDVGDEPLQFFKKFPNIQVAVDRDRTNGIKQLLKQENKPEIVLLDDAFQHRKVKASFYILLTKYKDLYTDDFMLPTGYLRESKRGAKRANIVVVTKCPDNLLEQEKELISKKLNVNDNQQLFFSTISYDEKLKGSEEVTLEELKEYKIVLVTGIANPTSMLDFLNFKNISFKHLQFSDHHNFSVSDINKIQKIFGEIQSEKKLILTTEKDFVRLQSSNLKKVSYLQIKTRFLNDENLFNSIVIKSLKN